MLHRFIAFIGQHIDRLSDRLYPVVVLEWRREFRGGGRGIVFTILCVLIAVAASVGLVFESEIETLYQTFYQDRHIGEIRPWLVIFPYIYILGLSSFVLAMVTLGRPAVWKNAYKIQFPDYYLAPVDRTSIFFGGCQWWVLRMVALYMRLLPFLVFAWTLRILSLSWVFFYPAVFWMLFFTLGNMFMPLSAFAVHPQKKRPWWKELSMGFIGGLIGTALVGIPVGLLMIVASAFWQVHVLHRPLGFCDGIVDFRYWFPMFLVGVTAYNAAVWPLARRVMRKEGGGPKKLLVIYGVYLFIGLSIAGIWFLLWFVFR